MMKLQNFAILRFMSQPFQAQTLGRGPMVQGS